MKSEAYYALHSLEEKHWWYVGARATYRTLLEIGLGKAQGDQLMLEIGSGSGGNLTMLSEYGKTIGIEPSRVGLELTEKFPTVKLMQARGENLPFVSNGFDGVHLLGVIEHLEDDIAALREAGRVCRPGGVITIMTSAHMFLWSHHDEANRHYRRYTREQLKDHLNKAGLAPIRISYQNFFTFLPTLLVRLWQRRSPQEARYDMGGLPPMLINSFLIQLLRLEARFIRYTSLPVGVDLVAVCSRQK